MKTAAQRATFAFTKKELEMMDELSHAYKETRSQVLKRAILCLYYHEQFKNPEKWPQIEDVREVSKR